jgi:hypothetical protein
MKNFLLLIFLIPWLASCSLAQNKEQVMLEVQEEQQRVEVHIGGELFTAYRYDAELEKPVLYPVYAPGGIAVTRGFPLEPRAKERIDHPHHVGLWFNFGDVNGFDFWNNSLAVPAERKGHYGRIIHAGIVEATSSGNRGVLEVKMDWVAPDNDRAEKLLGEHTTFLFSGNDGVRMVDRITRLTATADSVVFTDNKEGMLAIRVDRAFEHPSESPALFTDASGNITEVKVLDNEGVTGWYRNSEGDEGPDAWGKNASWVKLSGTKKDQPCSIIIMDHPDNINYPACWHARGYGLFSINNLGRQVYNKELERFQLLLQKGESITFKHRFMVASGDLDDEKIRELYNDFTSE